MFKVKSCATMVVVDKVIYGRQSDTNLVDSFHRQGARGLFSELSSGRAWPFLRTIIRARVAFSPNYIHDLSTSVFFT